MIEIDARGVACPEPVIRTKNAIEKDQPPQITVMVDNPASQENVKRFLESQGYETVTEQNGTNYLTMGAREGGPDLSMENTAQAQPQPASAPSSAKAKIMVLCSTDRMGYGDDELGKKLMISFIKTLKEMGDELWQVVLVNNGVKLSIGGSPVLEELQAFEKEGVIVLVCGTCLTHFDLLEEKQVGTTTNMLDIVTAMQLADKVIKI